MQTDNEVRGFCDEQKRVRLIEWLVRHDFYVGDCVGFICEPQKCEPHAIGIFRDNPKHSKRRGISKIVLDLLWPLRREFIATLWLENEARSATADRWVMDYHGISRLDECNSLAEKLADELNVDMRLQCSQSRQGEVLWFDFEL